MELLFIYNAKSGVTSAIFDYLHKIVSPSSYSCNLCLLTHSNFGKRAIWKDFEKKLTINMHFHHIDDFEKQYNYKKEYPVILIKKQNNLSLLLNKSQINNMNSIEELMASIKNKIKSE